MWYFEGIIAATPKVVSEMFDTVSYLKLLWGAGTIIVGGATVVQIFRGTHKDKTQDHKQHGEKLGLLQFRKRLSGYYCIGFLFTSWAAWNAFSAYCMGSAPNSHLTNLLERVSSPAEHSVSSTSILLASTMYQVHLFRRLYETLKVSIHSRKQVIGLLGTVKSYGYYIAAALSLFAEGPQFTEQSACVDVSSLGVRQVLALVLYTIGTYVHHQSHQQLATLRRNRFGHVTHTDYKMPKGSMFQFVSCPHYFAEILIYSSIALAMDMQNTTWIWLLLYVSVNQVHLARSTHRYYLTKFEDYPTGRRMLIPFLM